MDPPGCAPAEGCWATHGRQQEEEGQEGGRVMKGHHPTIHHPAIPCRFGRSASVRLSRSMR